MFFHGVKATTLNKVHVTLSKVYMTLVTLSRMRYISETLSSVGIWCVTKCSI